MSERIRVLVVGCGHMGSAHARAYHNLPGFKIAGLVATTPTRRGALAAELGGVPQFHRFEPALAATQPDAVCIATYPDTHADYCRQALEAGCHVFVEKPLAETAAQAEGVVQLARSAGHKLVVGYILRVHPAWQRFIEVARTLGKPLVMRMNLNQQSSGESWRIHKNLLASVSPLVDCGVHYVDVMCQMTGAAPVRVQAIGARLSDEIQPGMYNYGQLQVIFADSSIGWYEAGWGPMMSETAFFVKDVVGPLGSASLVPAHPAGGSAEVEGHTRANVLRVHPARLAASGGFAAPDELMEFPGEPDHQALCRREQQFFEQAIRADLDLGAHLQDALNSLRIVLAADESIRNGGAVRL